jgi:hypothetical protein
VLIEAFYICDNILCTQVFLAVNKTELKLIFSLHGEPKEKKKIIDLSTCVLNTNCRRLSVDGTEILYLHSILYVSFKNFASLVELHEILECLLYHNRKGNKKLYIRRGKICYFCDLIKNVTVLKKESSAIAGDEI